MYLLRANVGPVHPIDFARSRCHPRLEVGPLVVGGPPAREVDRVLRQVEWNLTALTSIVPMAEIEELPMSMQPHVVGVPRTWVHLFRRLANVIFHYGRANRPHT
jgi:hypothetical protein